MASPRTLRLPPGAPLTTEGLARRLQRQLARRSGGGLAPRFALSSRELRFVRALHARKANLWVWRCRQDAFAGDFVVVDMSEPDPARRRCWVLELKMGAPLKAVGGHQMGRADDALAELGAVLGPGGAGRATPLTGDGGAILGALTGGAQGSI